jgi:hypothetical protein
MRVPEASRVTEGESASDASYGHNGAFVLHSPEPGWALYCIASDELGWDHVSVSARRYGRTVHTRIPTWREMAFIKDEFWEPETTVLQYHPPHSRYVNVHPHVLHLWRPQNAEVQLPPLWMV